MVGVAGKSKGCATCRKRKVKCDEARPICKRCQHSRLQCDRYERFPVFIDRNQTGYRKRKPLEEVKPVDQPRHIYSPEAESARLISWFREGHIRSHQPRHTHYTQFHWLGLIGTRQPPHPALKTALLAVSFIKWSQVECNPELRQNGRRHYQQTLELTQKALLRTEDALSDDMLATVCVMALYELFDRSSDKSDNWLDHITGTGYLLCLRGPGDFATAESRAMLEHMRYIFMVRCLATRTSCVFGSPEWRQLPWGSVPKSIEQQVFDQGLRLTGLWKDCDSLSTDRHWSSDFDALLSTSIDIFETLDHLIVQIGVDTARTDTASVTDTATSLLNIGALGIQLGAAASAQKLLTNFDVGVSELFTDNFDTAFETEVKAQSLCRSCRPLALRIVRCVEARMKTQIGALGTLRMVWSLQLAQEQFTLIDSEAEECKAMLTVLSRRTSPFDVLRLPLGKHASSPVYRSFSDMSTGT